MRIRILTIVALCIGIIAGIAADRAVFFSVLGDVFGQPSCGTSYSLINPWLRCEPEQNLQQKKEFTNFKAGLMQQIDEWISQGRVDHISLYLRDLQFGPWMGIDEQETYSAASILKVPLMLAVLKEAERNPAILGQRVQVTPELLVHSQQTFKPERHVEPGEIYTVDELLYFMIVYSDNDAKNVLNTYLEVLHPGESLVMQTLQELGLIGEYRQFDDALTIKQVASLFRILYNSSYLNKDLTQKALELLTQSTFGDGIIAGLPRGTVVAHKFGEREDDSGEKQLHDCGIVYHQKNHYLLCVMTRGHDEHILASVIADVSRLINAEIEARANQDN